MCLVRVSLCNQSSSLQALPPSADPSTQTCPALVHDASELRILKHGRPKSTAMKNRRYHGLDMLGGDSLPLHLIVRWKPLRKTGGARWKGWINFNRGAGPTGRRKGASHESQQASNFIHHGNCGFCLFGFVAETCDCARLECSERFLAYHQSKWTLDLWLLYLAIRSRDTI